MTARVLVGDCREVLSTMEANSIDACVCDPPYGLEFMGKEWDRLVDPQYQKFGEMSSGNILHDTPAFGIRHRNHDEKNVGRLTEERRAMQAWHETWAREVYRVLKPGAHLLAFSGTRTSHRMVCAIEDAGFEIRDCLMWLYGSGFPKSLDVSKALDKAAGAERKVVSRGRTKWTATGRNERYGKLDYFEQDSQGYEIRETTAPATDLARQWDGWGTALKPSYEIVLWATKPLQLRDLCGIMAPTIKELLCQLKSSARDAESGSPSSRNELGAVSDSVLWNAVAQSSTPDDLYALTDTLPSEWTTILNSNIVWSWLRILGDLWKHANTFTTETVSSLITDLKTLNSLLSTITADSIIAAETQAHGVASNVWSADAIFRSVYVKSRFTRTTSADATAIGKGADESLRPDAEFIVLARKPLAGTVAANVTQYGTGALNIDGCRIGTDERWSASGVQSPRSTALSGGADGTLNISVSETHPLGRWPANAIFDEDAARLLDEMSGERAAGARPATRNVSLFGNGNGTNDGERIPTDSGGASRFFYTAKASRAERNKGLAGMPERQTEGDFPALVCNVCGCRRVLNYRPTCGHDDYRREVGQSRANHHPTVKPVDLMQWLVRLITPKGGTVLDPFMGSGSTGIAADREGMHFIGIEQDDSYAAIARKRIVGDCPLFTTLAAD
jgi:DNA modification methylase